MYRDGISINKQSPIQEVTGWEYMQQLRLERSTASHALYQSHKPIVIVAYTFCHTETEKSQLDGRSVKTYTKTNVSDL